MRGDPLSEVTRGALLREAEARLREAGVETARLDARLLLQHVAGLTHVDIVTEPGAPVASPIAQTFREAIAARGEGAPVAHLTGTREFWGLAFATGPGALVPRPDTETLVEAMLPHIRDGARVADLGTGTGCILAAILSERPAAYGIGIDLSAQALRLAARNLAAHAPGRAGLARSRWAEPLAPGFDAIVSNPPYIRRPDMAMLSPEVRRDPALALDGGTDGLDAYRALAPSVARVLAPGGWLGLEIGRGQETDVMAILEGCGFAAEGTATDLGGIVRVVLGRRLGS